MDLEELRKSKAATIRRSDAAELFGCDPRTITAGIEAGTIPAIRIGRRVVIPREPLLALLISPTAEERESRQVETDVDEVGTELDDATSPGLRRLHRAPARDVGRARPASPSRAF